MPARPPSWHWIILVFLVSLGFACGLEQLMRPLTPDGMHFHPWSSEDMMQTVSLGELRRHPLQSLTHIHIQPPAFDAIRAALSRLWPRLNDAEALQHVDLALYALGTALFAGMVTLVFTWLALDAGTVAGVLGALLVLLHPASMMFATFLDSTLLSAFLILCAYHLLWRLKNRLPTPMWVFSAVVLSLFFTRSIFQWQAVLLFALSLWLIGRSRRELAAYLLVTGLFSTLYLVKQSSQFGVFSTSSFSGMNLANSVGVGMGTAKYAAYLNDAVPRPPAESTMPGVLTATTKLDGQPNFNHIDYLTLNRELAHRFSQALKSHSLEDLWNNYTESANIYFRPSSSYSSGHVIVEHLPWRPVFEWVFSAPVLPVLLLLALIACSVRAFRTHTLVAGFGLLLPGLFVMLVSIIGDKGENMRFKFFLEPVMIVFLVSQASAVLRRSRGNPPGAPRHGAGPSKT